MRGTRWLELCRWVHVLLVVSYVLVTIMLVIVLLSLFGVWLANWVRWMMTVGWFAGCFGGVILMERVGFFAGQGIRRPIRSEEERLSGLMVDVCKRMDLSGKVHFLIRNDPQKKDGSFGARTIIIGSGTLMMASDGELKGILAHELGHLRDGDRVLEAAAITTGLVARGFRRVCRIVLWGLRWSVVAGLMLLCLMTPLLLTLLIFYLVDIAFRGILWSFRRWLVYRQDVFAFRLGCGEGLRAWLEKSGLEANVDRIRRLEKML
jgi:Zn-dependent protease with chaperone function